MPNKAQDEHVVFEGNAEGLCDDCPPVEHSAATRCPSCPRRSPAPEAQDEAARIVTRDGPLLRALIDAGLPDRLLEQAFDIAVAYAARRAAEAAEEMRRQIVERIAIFSETGTKYYDNQAAEVAIKTAKYLTRAILALPPPDGAAADQEAKDNEG